MDLQVMGNSEPLPASAGYPDLERIVETIELMIREFSRNDKDEAELLSSLWGKPYPVFERNDGG